MNVTDPAVARELFQGQPVMGHPQDVGLGHYMIRFLGKAMGVSDGKLWDHHRQVFKSSMTSAIADASLANIVASLDEWEEQTLQPLAKSDQPAKLYDISICSLHFELKVQ